MQMHNAEYINIYPSYHINQIPRVTVSSYVYILKD